MHGLKRLLHASIKPCPDENVCGAAFFVFGNILSSAQDIDWDE